MAGSAFFVALVVLVVLVIVGVGTPFLLVPLVLIALGGLVLLGMRIALRRTSVGPDDPGPSGVPSTRDASYEPVQKP
jgi:hypothetical protein